MALDQTRAGLTGLQPVAAATESAMTRGFQGSARAAQSSSTAIVASSRRMQFGLQNAAFQVADRAQQRPGLGAWRKRQGHDCHGSRSGIGGVDALNLNVGG